MKTSIIIGLCMVAVLLCGTVSAVPAAVSDSIDINVTIPDNLDTAKKAGIGYADREGIDITERAEKFTITSKSKDSAVIYIPVRKPDSGKNWQDAYTITHRDETGYPLSDKTTVPRLINKSWYVVFKNTDWSYLEVGGVMQFWNAVDIPTLHAAIGDNTKISLSGGTYTMHIPFYQNKSTDNFYFGETVRLKTVVGTAVAYYRWAGNTTFNNAAIHAWNTTSGTIVTDNSVARSHVYSNSGASGDITNCNMSYLGYNLWTRYGVFLGHNSDITITNNTYTHNYHGIYLYSSCDNNTLTSNNASGNAYNGIYLHSSCDNNTLTSNNASGNAQRGFFLHSSSNNTLTSNNASGNAYSGFFLYSSSNNNTLASNNASGNAYNGIRLDSSSNNTLTSNNASGNAYSGFFLHSSSNNTLTSNNASGNSQYGIFLYSSSNNTLTSNNASGNTYAGIHLDSSCDNNTLTSNNASGNSQYGIFLYSSSNNTLTSNNASGNAQRGFFLHSSSNNTLTSNNASGNTQSGIRLDSSCDNNTLTSNTASGNTQSGIRLDSSCDNNTLTSNNASGNAYSGFFLDSSCNNTLTSNNASGNTEDGIVLASSCNNNTLTSNNASGNAYSGFFLDSSCNNNTLTSNNASGNAHNGIVLDSSCNNTLTSNNASGNTEYGIVLYSSCNNTLIGNNVTGCGVYDYVFFSSSIANTIRDSASTTDKIHVSPSSGVNIENTDNMVFTEDSANITRAYPTNFSMYVTAVSQTFDITQNDMTITPSSDSVNIWNFIWGNVVTFNASNVSGVPSVWFNATNLAWANLNVLIYRDDVLYANETADVIGHIAYNYSGGWSEHFFEFKPVHTPDKPLVVVPANGATGTSTNPTLRVQVIDEDEDDTLNITFHAQGGAQIGTTQTGVANGGTASVVWSGRAYSTTYYWYAVADDGVAQNQSDTWHFTTQTDGGDGGGGGGSSHVILISGCTDWEGNAGSQVYIDFGCTGETAGATFTTNATNGSIESSSGIYTWNTDTADVGVYTWRFNVENVYTISDYCDVTITVYHYASPTNLAATTGNFWVNHTWGGNGFVDSYNVSVNDVWVNGSTDQHSYHVTTPHAWSNISVAAFNYTTGLSSFISNDVQVPNNPITLTNYTTLMLATAGDNVTVDMNHEDLDGDTATYYCSRMDLFTDFNTADGTGQYTNAVNGTHEVIFGVTDGYGWSNQTITIEVGTVHPLELDEETPLILFVVLVVLLFGSLFYIYHAASYVAKIVTALISTWMSFMLSNMAVSGNVVLNYAELSSGDVFVYGTHSIQIAALSHFFMFTGVISALFMLTFAVKLVIDTYLNIQEKRKADEEWDGVEAQ